MPPLMRCATMFLTRIEIPFDAGHRILGHSGKCASPHGHTFRAEVFFRSDGLNDLGFTIDFTDLKAALKQWIDSSWDHGFLLSDQDRGLIEALEQIPEAKLYVLSDTNPSAEGIARELFRVARTRLGESICSVRIWESPTQYAEYQSPVFSNGASTANALEVSGGVP